jgi:hypothetical protein
VTYDEAVQWLKDRGFEGIGIWWKLGGVTLTFRENLWIAYEDPSWPVGGTAETPEAAIIALSDQKLAYAVSDLTRAANIRSLIRVLESPLDALNVTIRAAKHSVNGSVYRAIRDGYECTDWHESEASALRQMAEILDHEQDEKVEDLVNGMVSEKLLWDHIRSLDSTTGE